MHMTAAESLAQPKLPPTQGLPVHSSQSESSWSWEQDRLPEWNLHTSLCALPRPDSEVVMNRLGWFINTVNPGIKPAVTSLGIEVTSCFGPKPLSCKPTQFRFPWRIWGSSWADQRNSRKGLWVVEGVSDEVQNGTPPGGPNQRMNEFSIQITFLLNA